MDGFGRCWNRAEGYGRLWIGLEGDGRFRRVMIRNTVGGNGLGFLAWSCIYMGLSPPLSVFLLFSSLRHVLYSVLYLKYTFRLSSLSALVLLDHCAFGRL